MSSGLPLASNLVCWLSPLDLALLGVGEVGSVGVAAIAERAPHALAAAALATAAAPFILLVFCSRHAQGGMHDTQEGGLRSVQLAGKQLMRQGLQTLPKSWRQF